jgi:hypothetical protein
MSKKKKPYRAIACLGKQSSLKACDTLEQARELLEAKCGGVIEKRAYKIMHSSGHGLERVEYDPPLRLNDWQFVERVSSSNVQSPVDRPVATHGFWIESYYPLISDWLPKEAFTTIYDNSSSAVATAIEGVEDQNTEVRVVDLSTGEVIWRSTEEEFE